MSEIQKAKHAATKNADRAAGMLDEAQDRFSDLVDSAKDKGEDLLNEVKDRGVRAWDDAQDRGEDLWKGVTTMVRKHPGPALGWAMVAGAVLYAFLTRRED